MIVQGSSLKMKFGTVIILAGGKSSRMGFDKQFLTINKKRLMNIVIEKLEEEFDEIIIVTNKPEEYKDFNYKIITDKIAGKGPLSGIHSGLTEAKSQYAFVIGCDMPNINIDYVRHMKKDLNEEDIEVCITRHKDGIEPFMGFYSKSIVSKIEKYLMEDKRAIYMFLDKLKVKYIEENKARKYTQDWDMFLNLNSQEDLDKYLKE